MLNMPELERNDHRPDWLLYPRNKNRTVDFAFRFTFPARSFGISGERRFFDLLRPVEAGSAEPRRVKDWILDEYRVASAGGAVAKTA